MGNCMLQLDRDAEVHLDAIDRDIEQEPKKFIKEHKALLLGEWLFNGHFVRWWGEGSWWGKWHELYTVGVDLSCGGLKALEALCLVSGLRAKFVIPTLKQG